MLACAVCTNIVRIHKFYCPTVAVLLASVCTITVNEHDFFFAIYLDHDPQYMKMALFSIPVILDT